MSGVILDTTAHMQSALAKVAANPAAPVARAALCWTGGLDSAICAALLREHYHAAEIVAITVDVGQGEDELLRARERAEALGLDLRFLDARAEFTEWLAKAIRANVDYNGYPCATSMTRQLIGATAAKYAAHLGCDAIVDGSSGKGNDQYRAQNPVAINGQRMPLAELVTLLNDVGGANGLGRIDIIEDGIMDLKSREIYEAPAAAMLLALHRDLEQLTLTRDEIQFKKMVDAQWSRLVFGAEWFTPLKADLDAFIAQSQAPVNGTYEIELYKGTMTILNRQSPSSLYFPEVRSIQSSSFDQRWCGPAAQVRALPFELLAKRDARWQAARGGAPITEGEG
ncbi:MAG: argininosuccinate synthase [Thermomicrobia bacterium]|nr:argininosuccinate synthase [Thermomicrobia bacterium]